MTIPRLLIFILIGAIAITLCYLYVDQSVVWFLNAHHSRDWVVLKYFANNITATLTFAILLYYIFFLLVSRFRKINSTMHSLFLICNAVAVGQFLKDVFKHIFGRYWTATFVCNNPSLVRDHKYGFNWFHSGTDFASFPSGHTTFIVSFSVSLWILFPKFRWLSILLSALVMVGQIGMYYHFVSDVIGGIMLGTLVAVVAAAWQKKQPKYVSFDYR